MLKVMTTLLTITTLLFFVSGCYLYTNQRDFLYYPQPYKQDIYPSLIIQSDTAEIDVIKLDGQLVEQSTQEQVQNQTDSKKKAIIYFGGNAEPVMYSADMFTPLNHRGHDVYLVNYRGYGESTGTITEKNNYQDAIAVYQHITDSADNTYDSIDVVGRSIGTGVATYLAEQKPVDKLVLITPYESLLTLAQTKLPIFPITLILKDTYPSADRAKNIDAKVLILSAENDTLIPVIHAKKLAAAFIKPPMYHEVQDANHNDIMDKTKAREIFYQFLNE